MVSSYFDLQNKTFPLLNSSRGVNYKKHPFTLLLKTTTKLLRTDIITYLNKLHMFQRLPKVFLFGDLYYFHITYL